MYLIYLQVISTWIQSRYPEELKEVPSIQVEEAVLSVVAEDGSQVPVLKREVVGNVPHRHVFRCHIIVTWILRKCFYDSNQGFWSHFNCLKTQTHCSHFWDFLSLAIIFTDKWNDNNAWGFLVFGVFLFDFFFCCCFFGGGAFLVN